jgi:glycosyltransferase involved in cell wall biosynthesis
MLPISVVIPHRKSRSDWFRQHCLPSVHANDPAEILIEDREGGACEKRNAGAARATQRYLLFADDDSILLSGALREMMDALEGDPGASFAYSDTKMILYPGVPYPNPPGVRRAQPWNIEALKKGNYVETMSLMRRDVFPGFDPGIQRFQDWDLWLTLAAAGHRGVYIPKVLFELHHFDAGISASIPFEESLARIRRKHRL